MKSLGWQGITVKSSKNYATPPFAVLSIVLGLHGLCTTLEQCSSKLDHFHKRTHLVPDRRTNLGRICQVPYKRKLLVPRTGHHPSSFKCSFLNIFSRQNLLCSLSRLLFLLPWNKYGAKKCLKNHIPFDF